MVTQNYSLNRCSFLTSNLSYLEALSKLNDGNLQRIREIGFTTHAALETAIELSSFIML